MISVCEHHRGGVLDRVFQEVQNRAAFNTLKVDPTRSTELRNRFVKSFKFRIQSIYNDLYDWLVKSDELALNARRYEFQSDPTKLKGFNQWLEGKISEKLLTAYEDGSPWLYDFIEEAYKKGYARAYDQVNAYEQSKATVASKADKAGFLSRGLSSPVSADRLETLATRSFEYVKGMSQDMKANLNRVLVDGLSNGSTPKQIARDIRDELDISLTRAERIARTEITHAHAEAQLDSYAALNIGEAAIEVEWMTAGGACPACEEMASQGPYRIAEAHGLIPYHPNCRCAWIPSVTTTNARITKKGTVDKRAGRDADGDGIYDEKPVKGGSKDRVLKAHLGKLTHKPVNKKVRAIGDYWGDTVVPKEFGVTATGRFADGSEGKKGHFRALDTVGIDSEGRKHAIEVKTIQPGKKNDRVDMKTHSVKKKEKDFRKYKFDFRHLIAVDLRQKSRTRFFYAPKWGAFSVSTMMEFKDLKSLKQHITKGKNLKPFTAYHKASS